MLKDLFTSMQGIDQELNKILDLPIEALRAKLVEMFKSARAEKEKKRVDRILMIFIVERLQDLEKEREAPYGREAQQTLLDNAIRALETQHGESTHLSETFSGIAKLERVGRVSDAVPQTDLQHIVNTTIGPQVSASPKNLILPFVKSE